MKTIKTKLQSAGFTSGHAKLLTVAFAVFAVLFFAQSDLNIRTLFAVADEETVMLSYDDVRKQVEGEYGISNSTSPNDEEILKQIELLDRGGMDGSVLGEAIGIGAIPDADELLLPEITSQIEIKTFGEDSEQSRLYYQKTTAEIETNHNIISLLGGLNSSDEGSLRNSVNGWQAVINDLSDVAVPQSLQKFHQTKLYYYGIMMNIGKVYAGDKTDADLQLLTKAMLSYSQKIETLRSQVNAEYSLSL